VTGLGAVTCHPIESARNLSVQSKAAPGEGANLRGDAQDHPAAARGAPLDKPAFEPSPTAPSG
jgi:hypothetical protein